MDVCRLLLKAIDAGVSLREILAMDVADDLLTQRLSRLVRLGLVTFYDDEARITPEGRHVLRYIAPEQQWAFLRATVSDASFDSSLAAFDIMASRILAHVPTPIDAREAELTSAE
jgi:hypothetical protein